MNRLNLQAEAINRAGKNPIEAMVYAILDLAQSVRECGTDLEELATQHNLLALETGVAASALHEMARVT